jgi:hypothetical protein
MEVDAFALEDEGADAILYIEMFGQHQGAR